MPRLEYDIVFNDLKTDLKKCRKKNSPAVLNVRNDFIKQVTLVFSAIYQKNEGTVFTRPESRENRAREVIQISRVMGLFIKNSSLLCAGEAVIAANAYKTMISDSCASFFGTASEDFQAKHFDELYAEVLLKICCYKPCPVQFPNSFCNATKMCCDVSLSETPCALNPGISDLFFAISFFSYFLGHHDNCNKIVAHRANGREALGKFFFTENIDDNVGILQPEPEMLLWLWFVYACVSRWGDEKKAVPQFAQQPIRDQIKKIYETRFENVNKHYIDQYSELLIQTLKAQYAFDVGSYTKKTLMDEVFRWYSLDSLT